MYHAVLYSVGQDCTLHACVLYDVGRLHMSETRGHLCKHGTTLCHPLAVAQAGCVHQRRTDGLLDGFEVPRGLGHLLRVEEQVAVATEAARPVALHCTGKGDRGAMEQRRCTGLPWGTVVIVEQ